jgi:hypothetical protein
MVFKLKEKTMILQRLYRDPVCYVEEISLIEEDYLWQNVSIYIDDPRSIQEFLIVHSPTSYWGGRSLSAYMTAENPSTIRKFASVLKVMKNFRTHLQTSIKVEDYVKQFMKWLTNTYTVRYCCANSKTFKPYCLHKKGAIRLTPDNIKKYQTSASSHFIKRIETAPVYGYVNDKGELVATSGVGFLTKKSFAISYTETKQEYRSYGIAKCLTSLASEHLISKGLIGVYCTDILNKPSLKVAKALGFLPYRDLKCFYN